MKIIQLIFPIFILFLIVSPTAIAQKCHNYDCFMQLAMESYNQADYGEAYKNFKQAQKQDASKTKEVDNLIASIFAIAEGYKIQATKAEKEVQKMKDSLSLVVAEKDRALDTIQKYSNKNKALEKIKTDLTDLTTELDSINNVLHNNTIRVESINERLNYDLKVEEIRNEELETSLKKRRNRTQAIVKSTLFAMLATGMFYIQGINP
jgi:chromosome segregation ATPase